MNLTRVGFAISALVAFGAVVAAAGEVELVDGVPHVHVGAEPDDGIRTLHLRELWHIDAEDEEQLIGVVSGVLAGPEGTTYMGDQQLGQILVYGSDGEYMRTLSRQGEGPGEINAPHNLVWLPDGSLGIIDRKPGQITTLDAAGLPLSPIRLRGSDGEPMASAQLMSVRCRGGTLALSGTQFGFDDGPPTQTRFFSIFDAKGREVKRLMEAPSGFDFGARTYDEKADYFVNTGVWAIDGRGRVYHAPYYDRYLIEVHDAEGRLIQVIERDFVAAKRTSKEKEEIRKNTVMTIDGEFIPLDCDLQDRHAAIGGIEAGLGDGIWVRNGRDEHDLPAGIIRSYDVFDGDGNFREVVRLAGEMDKDADRLYHLADDRWILLRNIAAARRAMFATYNAKKKATGEVEDIRPLQIVCLQPV